MIEFLTGGTKRARLLAGIGFLTVIIQWWMVPLLPMEWTGKWLWALDTSRGFPAWFQFFFPLFLLLAPLRSWLEPVFRKLSQDPSRILNVVLMTLIMGGLFWILRVGVLTLGDSRLIMDYFVALTTYASVREPLESILHAEFSRYLFHHYGIHPKTSFQILSCLWGGVAILLAGIRLSAWGREKVSYLSWLWFLLLIAPVHLFFGYIEWYTQFAVGLILFEIYGVSKIVTGKGLLVALSGLLLACCSHMVGLGFLPAGILLICLTLPQKRRISTLILTLAGFGLAMALTLWWIRRNIVFDHSVKATMRLFTTLLPLMRADNPENPPGAWQYPWLSSNHLADLFNEILLCGLFPLMLLAGSCPLRVIYRQCKSILVTPFQLFKETTNEPPVSDTESTAGTSPSHSTDLVSKRLIVFFFPQFLLGAGFLLLWNPWLGFPTDWDLFSFFTWPLLMAALVVLAGWSSVEDRRNLLWIAGLPAFSVVAAWIVFYHNGSLPSLSEMKAALTGNLAKLRWQEAQQAIEKGDWPLAFEKTEATMREDPARIPECLSLMGTPVVQRMSDQWPEINQITRMACDMEIISSSPTRRLFVLDSWGRIFLWEGGIFNDWAPQGIPGIPRHHAVAMEIAPWRKAAVILRDDGALYEVPIPSWVDPEPRVPRQTWVCEPPPDHSPRPLGNLFYDYARLPFHPARMAMDLVVDPKHKRLVALDNIGDLISDQPGLDFQVEKKAAFIGIDVELNGEGTLAFIGNYFGGLNAWPGGESPIKTGFDFYWPAIADYEPARGGEDLYVLDVQGGIFAFTRLDSPLIDPVKMQHYSPRGEKEPSTPYLVHPTPFFSDIELVPGEKAFYRMLWNFRIYYAEQKE